MPEPGGPTTQASPALSPWAAGGAKRLFDLALALPLLVLALPVIGLLAVLIRLDTPGPAIFSQPRVGRDGRLFLCRKLRTMHAGTVSVATHDAPVSAVTGLGRLLRRLKLDELPQLWNVVRGEMSLVGARPCLPIQEELLRLRREGNVLTLRPGITGLAQVSGVDMSRPALCAQLDRDYATSASPGGDLRLMLATVLPRLAGRPQLPPR